MEKGFLRMLRPFSGKLIEENYHEIIKAIKTLADELRDKKQINKDIISAIWAFVI